MKLIIGSKNPTKIRAATRTFQEFEVVAKAVPSGVSEQPLSDEETRQGAMNRAQVALQEGKGDLGAGLEGGVLLLDKTLYLCNWGALATTDGKIYTASGARIELPETFLDELESGEELSGIMEAYTKLKHVRLKEGAVGIFTNELIDRSEMFTHVMKLLRGQWEYWSK
jgi:inosine/xanthosine triphosphatase